MNAYNPLQAPDPKEWGALDESGRIYLVERFHRHARVKLPSVTAHAAIHAAVETQVAMGDETPVRRTVERLMSEGLDRHDAVHAVGMALAAHMYDMVKRKSSSADPNAEYFARVEKLTAKAWRESGQE